MKIFIVMLINAGVVYITLFLVHFHVSHIMSDVKKSKYYTTITTITIIVHGRLKNALMG